jgi:dienelactone hydrolase
MKQLYARWMHNWENRLCFRSTDRVVRPFEWGLEYAEWWPAASGAKQNGHGPEQYLRLLNQRSIAASPDFFGYEPPTDFRLENGFLRFRSAVPSPHPANDVVHAQWFPAKKPNGTAVVVLPHWNSTLAQHGALCRGIAALGISALRLSLPYHDYRMPAELHRADYAMSSNIGRTIHATRQAVVDVRSCLDWLESQGYNRLGIVGTSIGSCYAFLASAHDPRLKVNVYNHCSSYVADVVWTGLSTQHVRQGIEGNMDLDSLREVWRAISPVSYLDRYAAQPVKKSLFIYTKYDTTFLPNLSVDIIRAVREHKIPNKVVVLPCGHYTMGETPFKFVDGYQICSFLKRNL